MSRSIDFDYFDLPINQTNDDDKNGYTTMYTPLRKGFSAFIQNMYFY